ncbi:hypothetical protein PInf_025304 [Phytophthora infestans]|nr:hypothetical protein PInf_025304 [Phytophthora infestans]
MFATKTKYWDQRKAPEVLETVLALPGLAPINDQSPRRQEFELIQTQLVARHGIRYPTLGNIKESMAF